MSYEAGPKMKKILSDLTKFSCTMLQRFGLPITRAGMHSSPKRPSAKVPIFGTQTAIAEKYNVRQLKFQTLHGGKGSIQILSGVHIRKGACNCPYKEGSM